MTARFYVKIDFDKFFIFKQKTVNNQELADKHANRKLQTMASVRCTVDFLK